MSRSHMAIPVWIVVSALFVVVMSLGIAHAPPPFKRLGLSYAVFGLLCGLFMRWFAGEQKLAPSVKLGAVAALLVGVGAANIGWQSYLQLKEVRAAELSENPKQLAMLNMMKNIAGDEASEDYELRRRELQPEFIDYLKFRVTQLGDWQRPWPLLFWSGEVLVAAVLSVLIVSGLIFREGTVQSFTDRQKTQHEVELNS